MEGLGENQSVSNHFIGSRWAVQARGKLKTLRMLLLHVDLSLGIKCMAPIGPAHQHDTIHMLH